MRRTLTTILFLSVIFCRPVCSQTVALSVSEGSTMAIAGTSTLQDWSSDVTEIKGTVSLNEKLLRKANLKNGDKLESVSISVPVLSIKSPRGETMEQKIYNALKSDTHPNIKFNLTDNQVLNATKDSFQVEAKGILEVAGKTKPVTLLVTGKKLPGDTYSFEGSHKLNMREYEIEPPSAMFGQIVTGEEVEISFKLLAKK